MAYPSTNKETPRVTTSSVELNFSIISEMPPLYADEAKPTARVEMAVTIVMNHFLQGDQFLGLIQIFRV